MGMAAPRQVGSSWTRGWTISSALAGGFLSTGPPGKCENSFWFVAPGLWWELMESSPEKGNQDTEMLSQTLSLHALFPWAQWHDLCFRVGSNPLSGAIPILIPLRFSLEPSPDGESRELERTLNEQYLRSSSVWLAYQSKARGALLTLRVSCPQAPKDSSAQSMPSPATAKTTWPRALLNNPVPTLSRDVKAFKPWASILCQSLQGKAIQFSGPEIEKIQRPLWKCSH